MSDKPTIKEILFAAYGIGNKPMETPLELTKGDIGNLITGLDQAIEHNECLIESSLPRGLKGREWTKGERDDEAEWTANLEIFRALRAKLEPYARS